MTALRLVTPPPSVEQRRAATRADLLARIRANVPERREVVRYRSGVVWRQDAAHLARVLAAKAGRELADDEPALPLADVVDVVSGRGR